MKNNIKDYSKVKGLLTMSIRYLEMLKECISKTHEAFSEVEYWQSSLELVRNCLYDVDKEYFGQLDILESIKEIRQEITNTLKIVKNFDIKSIKYLDKTWSSCKKAEELLS